MPDPGREAENWLSASGVVWGMREGEAYGVDSVEEGKRRKEGVMEAQGCDGQREKVVAMDNGRPLPLPGWGLAPGECKYGMGWRVWFYMGLPAGWLEHHPSCPGPQTRRVPGQPSPSIAGRGLQGFLWIL